MLVDQKMILFSKYLNPMILPVSDENVPGRVDRNALQPLELAIVLAPPAEWAEECTVRVEDLDPVVAGI